MNNGERLIGTWLGGGMSKEAGDMPGYVEGCVEKSAYTDDTVRVQQYMPLADRRELTEGERDEIDKAQKRWLPRLFASTGDSISSKMFAPRTSSVLGALGGGAAGAILGGYVGGGIGGVRAGLSDKARDLRDGLETFGVSDRLERSVLEDAYNKVVREGVFSGARVGAVAGVLALATLGGVLSYKARQKSNRNLEDRMRRLPEGRTTIRDMESDPVYQKDVDRRQAALRTALLAGAVLNR